MSAIISGLENEPSRHSCVAAMEPLPKLSLHVIRTSEELSALSSEWATMLSEYPPASTFSTPDWLISWWKVFGRTKQLLVLTLNDSNSRLVGIAPLSFSRERMNVLVSLRVVRLLGDGSGDSDNLDLPVRPGFEQQFGQAIMEFLGRQKRQWDLCLLNTMPANSPMCNTIAQMLKTAKWRAFEYTRDCSSIPLPESWDKYLLQLSNEDRNNVGRYTRRLRRRYSVRVYRCTRKHELPVCLDALFRLHQLRWQEAGEPGSFSSAERRRLYGDLSLRLLEQQQLELWVLEIDGAIAAVQFGFRFGNKVFQLQEGYDPARASDRVGFILRAEVLKQLIAENVRHYDFLGGLDSYKARWGAEPGHYRDLHFASSFSLGAAWLWYVSSAKRYKDSLRRKLPPSLWKLLHNINLGVQSGLSEKANDTSD